MNYWIFLKNFTKFKETMDYKNLSYRLLSSLFLIILLLLSIHYLSNYLFIIISLIYAFVFYEILRFFKINYFKLIILYSYLLISFLSIQIYLIYFYDKIVLLYFILIVILFDSFSYFAGSWFGKTKIFKNLSPSKTYVGLFFGITATLLISFFINSVFLIFTNINFLIFNFFIIIFSFFGDIFESYFKRQVNIKDSSNLIPGHGGFFDRFDGFLMGVIPLLFLSYFI